MGTNRESTAGWRRSRRRAGLMVILVAVFFVTAGSLAAFPDAFVLNWWTVGSIATMSGDAISLSGSAGQADAGSMSGGAIRLSGGYWNPPIAGGVPAAANYRVVLPAVLRGP